jgi:hypothetical protein
MQLVLKKFAQPELMLTSDFVSMILNFQGRGHQEKHPDDIVRNQPAEKGVGKMQFRHHVTPVGPDEKQKCYKCTAIAVSKVCGQR